MVPDLCGFQGGRTRQQSKLVGWLGAAGNDKYKAKYGVFLTLDIQPQLN